MYKQTKNGLECECGSIISFTTNPPGMREVRNGEYVEIEIEDLENDWNKPNWRKKQY